MALARRQCITRAAPNTTSFRAEPCTSPPPVGRQGSSVCSQTLLERAERCSGRQCSLRNLFRAKIVDPHPGNATHPAQAAPRSCAACSLLLAAVGRGAPQPEAVRRNAGADLGATCAGRLAPTARTRQRTRVAEGRRGRDFAKKPSAFAETAQSGSIRRPQQQREESKRGSSAKTVVWRPVDRLPCSCLDGQKGNPGYRASPSR